MTTIERRVLNAVFAASLVAAGPACARTYKWVDARGTTHYSQTPPADADVQVRVIELERGAAGGAHGCRDLLCRLNQLQSQSRVDSRAGGDERPAAKKAAGAYPVWPTPVEETDEERIARLVAKCKRSRGSDCESDREKRRMLLQNVDLTQAERRALRGLSPEAQRRVLLQRIPKRYREID